MVKKKVVKNLLKSQNHSKWVLNKNYETKMIKMIFDNIENILFADLINH